MLCSRSTRSDQYSREHSPRSSSSRSFRRRKRSRRREPTPSSSSDPYDSENSHSLESSCQRGCGKRPVSENPRKRRRQTEHHASGSRRHVCTPSPDEGRAPIFWPILPAKRESQSHVHWGHTYRSPNLKQWIHHRCRFSDASGQGQLPCLGLYFHVLPHWIWTHHSYH